LNISLWADSRLWLHFIFRVRAYAKALLACGSMVRFFLCKS
jgi:hypothetical protein